MAWRERVSSLLDLEGGGATREGSSSDQSASLQTSGPGGFDGRGSAQSSGARASAAENGAPGSTARGSLGPAGPGSGPRGSSSGADAAAGPSFASPPPAAGSSETPLGQSPSLESLGLGILRVPRSPSFPPVYGSGRSYNIRIGDEQQILARFTPRTSQSVYYLGDTVSGVLSFPPASQSKKPLKRQWRCLEVSVQLETHESSAPERGGPSSMSAPAGHAADFVELSSSDLDGSATDLDESTSSSSQSSIRESRQGKKAQQQQLAPLRATGSTSVVVRTEYHEVVLDLSTTHFLFTIPADAPPAGSSPSRALQWVLHFEFVAFALPTRPKKPQQQQPAPQGQPARRSTAGSVLDRIEETGSDGRYDQPFLSKDGGGLEDGDIEDEEDEEDEENANLLRLLVDHQQQGGGGTLGRGLQAEKASWSMPIIVHAPPLTKRTASGAAFSLA